MGKIFDINGNERTSTPKEPKYTMADSEEMKCAECGDNIFVQGVQFRKISKIITGEPRDTLIPIEIYLCGSCGEINMELYMDTMKQMGIKK